ncbi:putative defense protein 3 [Rhipicephalus sanguineus]|uniref:putative defense protein 3 n=1 Tax=Rhipicephalus sanguineus TaxID=34632 RepID=UPI0018955DA9|nr:putative defense protein 3 [Rhipicephalus sanguineus]
MFLRNLCLLFVLSRGTVCYRNGAPAGACDHMTPKHGPGIVPSTDKGNLGLSATLDDKRIAKVLLVGTFKGFLIKAVNKDGGLVSGKFAIDNSFMKGVDCDGHKDSAVTHVNNSEKSSVSVTWTAPDSFTGDVMFRATVVRTKPDFYVGLMSSAVKIQAPSPSDNHKSDKDGKTGKQDSSATSLYGLPVWPLALVLSCVALNARHWLAFP